MGEKIYYKTRRYSPQEFYREFGLDIQTEAVREVSIDFDNITEEFVVRIEVENFSPTNGEGK